VQELFLDGKYKEAAMAVPFEFIDQTSLLGSPARIADRLAAYEAAGVTTLSITPVAETLEQRLQVVRLMSDLVDDTPDAA
jgi:alkanesulfonate monooxygenase SsuD/methylene tetrahydromethanopterin reductase-like flavin-dependent oxidoreductase (luciferase family)